jgi:SNF2 family DNA or RNA helicase
VKADMAEEMRKELGVFMVYRERESTAQGERVYVDLTPEQARVYHELEDTCLAELEDGSLLKAKAGVAMMTRLRQVADGLGTVTDNRLSDSSKVVKTLEVIRDTWERGDDYAIFVWYKPTAHALLNAIETELGEQSWLVTGDIPQKERTHALARFRAGERRVFIGTIPTIGESVNLQRANHVIRVNRAWNPALNRQVLDRVDRQGQTRPVYLTDIIARGTVDELAVLPNLANKEALRKAVLGGGL